jgi:hypothetical protein
MSPQYAGPFQPAAGAAEVRVGGSQAGIDSCLTRLSVPPQGSGESPFIPLLPSGHVVHGHEPAEREPEPIPASKNRPDLQICKSKRAAAGEKAHVGGDETGSPRQRDGLSRKTATNSTIFTARHPWSGGCVGERRRMTTGRETEKHATHPAVSWYCIRGTMRTA